MTCGCGKSKKCELLITTGDGRIVHCGATPDVDEELAVTTLRDAQKKGDRFCSVIWPETEAGVARILLASGYRGADEQECVRALDDLNTSY